MEMAWFSLILAPPSAAFCAWFGVHNAIKAIKAKIDSVITQSTKFGENINDMQISVSDARFDEAREILAVTKAVDEAMETSAKQNV